MDGHRAMGAIAVTDNLATYEAIAARARRASRNAEAKAIDELIAMVTEGREKLAKKNAKIKAAEDRAKELTKLVNDQRAALHKKGS